jgi:hypothetical protein
MTRSLEEKRGLSAPDAKVLGDIQRVGWHVTGVFAQKDEKGPEWAFSIGLFHSFQHPEVVVLARRHPGSCHLLPPNLGGLYR